VVLPRQRFRSYVTATVTDSLNDTSPLAPCKEIETAGSLAWTASPATEGNAAQVVVTRLIGAVGQISVDYATSDGSAKAGLDYLARSGTLSFADQELQKTFTVPTLDDPLYEGSESFNVAFSNPTGGAEFTPPGILAIQIDDNDAPPSASIDNLSIVKAKSGTSNAVFTVRLSGASGLPASWSYHTSDGTALAGLDYQATSGTLAFAPGETVKTIAVAVIGDARDLPDQYFDLVLNAASGVEPATISGRCTIISRDAAIVPASLSMPKGTTASLAIVFRQPASLAASVALSSSQPGFVSVPPSVPVPAGSRSVSFEVTALNAPATARIEASLPAALGGQVIAGSVTSYDSATLVLRPASLSLPAGSSATVTASLTPPSDAPQTVSLESTAPNVAGVPSSFIIPAGGSATFTVTTGTRGSAVIRATLPPRYGSMMTELFVGVSDAPQAGRRRAARR
jgi:hypothetical protein